MRRTAQMRWIEEAEARRVWLYDAESKPTAAESLAGPEILLTRKSTVTVLVARIALARLVAPGFGPHALPLPNAATQQQQSDARLVAGMDEDPAAPMRAAGHRLHPPAVDLDIGIAVAVPFPILGGADRVHDQ